MSRKKLRRDGVIRAQRETIEAQDALIEWLLQRVEQERNATRGNDSPTQSEVHDGDD
jgi:hypothetical protein